MKSERFFSVKDFGDPVVMKNERFLRPGGHEERNISETGTAR
jgi:hypothetical protein